MIILKDWVWWSQGPADLFPSIEEASFFDPIVPLCLVYSFRDLGVDSIAAPRPLLSYNFSDTIFSVNLLLNVFLLQISERSDTCLYFYYIYLLLILQY